MKRRNFLKFISLAPFAGLLGKIPVPPTIVSPKIIEAAPITDIWISPKALEDIRNWAVYEIDDRTRREIFQDELR